MPPSCCACASGPVSTLPSIAFFPSPLMTDKQLSNLEVNFCENQDQKYGSNRNSYPRHNHPLLNFLTFTSFSSKTFKLKFGKLQLHNLQCQGRGSTPGYPGYPGYPGTQGRSTRVQCTTTRVPVSLQENGVRMDGCCGAVVSSCCER
eukprot:3940273-Rhodomonas_salina.1